MSFSDYFSLEELCASDYATRFNINNVPDAQVFERIKVLIAGLDRVRSILRVPMHINSGYRSPTLNAAIGGAKNSAHMKGLAADFVAPGFGTPLEICKAISEHSAEIGFDQCIQEGKWVHIAFPDINEKPKGELLTAHFGTDGTRYTQGFA